jgi:hypothetical protein
LENRCKEGNMAKRKSLSKKIRFQVFQRDGFTCQYCGRQPPEVALEVDHITPIVEGGTSDIMNLLTSCRACNRGKGRIRLDCPPQRPDADLAWLAMQQEIAELRAYQQAKQQRDDLLCDVVIMLQDTWQELTSAHWRPEADKLLRMLTRYSPQLVEDALKVTAIKYKRYGFDTLNSWEAYTWGVLRNMAAG